MPSVLFLTRWYPPCDGHFIRNLARAVSAFSEVHVLVPEPCDSGGLFRFRCNYESDAWSGVGTLRVSYQHLRAGNTVATIVNLLSYEMAILLGLRFYARRKIRFNLVHVHVLTRTALIPFLLKIFTGKPYILSEYWTRYLEDHLQYRGWWRKKITGIIVRQSAAVTAVSDYLRSAMKRQGIHHENFLVIPPAINTKTFYPSERPPIPKKKRIIHISTFSDQSKNMSGILRTLHKLAATRNDFECCLVGGATPYREEAEELAADLGLLNRFVFFTGVKFQEDLAAEIREADFLVMFSNYETFSIVLQEALACGKPVIATRIGPIPRLISQDAGILVDRGDEEQLLAAIAHMLDHSHEYDPGLLHAQVVSRFGYGIAGKEYADLYGKVTK